jgi:hypothetical protein
MAKAIYACARARSFGSSDEDRLKKICGALEPDNITSSVSHRVSIDDRTAWAIMNPSPRNLEKNNSLLLGYLYDRSEEWEKPQTSFPDGSYAIFRCDDECFEAVADPVASRTVWYYFDDELLIASTSQRAIVMFLGSFDFNEKVVPWMLSSGTLGPGLSWDRRIEQLPADSSVILDRNEWSITVNRNSVSYTEAERSDKEHEKLLGEAVTNTIGSLVDLGLEDWALPLSGGYDSRAILSWLKEAGLIDGDFRTVTWGLEGAESKEGSDARIAKDVAAALGVAHRYYHTDQSVEPVANVIDRYLSCAEGRSDHISAYMDGMRLWRELLGDGVLGIIKGDQFFGWPPVSSPILARLQVGCQLCSDYSNLTGVIGKYGLPEQEFPDDLERKGESLLAWRDRLYLTYRIPTFVAAMSDIKFSYMEQVSPLLSRMILERTKELPDRLRVGKGMLKRLADGVSPPLPYADRDVTERLEDVLKDGRIVALVRDTLREDYARTLFAPEFLEWTANGISGAGDSPGRRSGSIRNVAMRLAPKSVRKFLRDSGAAKLVLDGNVLAFRVYMIIRMHQILGEDSKMAGGRGAVHR